MARWVVALFHGGLYEGSHKIFQVLVCESLISKETWFKKRRKWIQQ